MGKRAVDFKFNGETTPYVSYDSTKTNLGSLIKQYSGVTSLDVFAGPAIIGMARPMEQSTAIPGIFPHAIQYSDTVDWVFLADGSAAAATRRIILYEYNKSNSVFNWKGFITLTFPTITNHTIRGMRAVREFYTTGTINISDGTIVTGSGSTWSASSICVGSRIGFGSTSPTGITTWYEISTINSDTSLTLSTSAPVFSEGTNYIIEDLKILTTTTNATATNGGLFVAKGLRYEDFKIAGTTIPAAVTTDNIKAVYYLSDANPQTNTTSCGLAIDSMISFTAQTAYVINATGPIVYVYNFRAPLTLLSGGRDTGNTLTVKTGIQAVTGTISQANNGRVGVLNNGGAGSGEKSLYFVTTTRVYRANVNGITNSSTGWQSDVMTEVPPGSINTFAATSTFSSVEISNTIDRLIIASTGAAGARSYVTQYNTIGSQFDSIFLIDDKLLNQSSSDSDAPVSPSTLSLPFSVWSEGGILYLARIGTVASNNQVYTLPIGADWLFQNSVVSQRLITPALSTPNALRFYNVYVNTIEKLGSDIFGIDTEPFKLYYRTSGIASNVGVWNLLGYDRDLSGVAPSTEIQFMFEFKILGYACIPARILSLSLIYEDATTDSHYEPSVANSSIPNRIFAYRQGSLWSSIIPNLRIQLFNATTNVNILDDNITASAYGIFEYSSDDGLNWLSWDNSADVVGNYIRYTATSLPDGAKVRALLTQN